MQKENPNPIKLDDYNRGLNDGLEHGKSARIKLNARVAALEAALKPFADVANYFDNEPRYTDEDSPCEAFNTFADLRAARAAYLGEKE
jgi:hypothetical protein